MVETSERQPASDQDWFLRAWQTYRKYRDLDYMFHSRVYALLRRELAVAPPGFHFLDVACGDAAASAGALAGSAVGRYTGIDISRPALDLARRELAALHCPVALIERDFPEALAEWREPVDVVWIGQSLHHFPPDGKLAVMRDVRRILAPGGRFLIWEPTALAGRGPGRLGGPAGGRAAHAAVRARRRRVADGDRALPRVGLSGDGRRLAGAGAGGRVRGRRELFADPTGDRAGLRLQVTRAPAARRASMSAPLAPRRDGGSRRRGCSGLWRRARRGRRGRGRSRG